MNPRERALAIAVGVIGLLLAGWFIQQGIDGRFRARRNIIADLESKLSRQKQEVLLSTIATRKRTEYEERSLPSQPALARSLYQEWLLEQVKQADLDQPKITALASRDERGAMLRHQFTITGQARLDQLVRLLYEFHKVNLLHRISALTVTPVKDSKKLELHLTVEALSLRTAPPDGKLPLAPSPRLAATSLDDFLKPIEERNLFGPPNRAPQLASTSQSAQTNRLLDVSLKASDPDPLDKVTYRLVGPSGTTARLDSASGKFQWTPSEPGKYEFLIEAKDDGIPARSKQEKLVVTVTNPPPPTPPPPAKLAFDDAKFTTLTAILETGEEGEVWLHVRPRGKTLKLREGQSFEVGSIKGRVTQIGESHFTFEADGKLRRLHTGEILEQAEAETTTSTETSSQSSAVN